MKASDNLASVAPAGPLYVLRLYVAGAEQHSRLARENLQSICDEYLKDRCRIVEVDVLTDFTTALQERIFVTPALVLEQPEPRVTVVGTLGDRGKVLSALRLGI